MENKRSTNFNADKLILTCKDEQEETTEKKKEKHTHTHTYIGPILWKEQLMNEKSIDTATQPKSDPFLLYKDYFIFFV